MSLKLNESYTVGTYSIMTGESGKDTRFSDPAKAIEQWFKLNKTHRTEVAIMPASKSEGTKLLKWASEHNDLIKKWASQYNCPYKVDFLLNSINSKASNDKSGMDWDGDQCEPFSFG